MKEKQQRGFTLIELMFTIVVLAVLLGIGVPNFRDFIRNSRLTAAANDMLADYNLARSEAIKRRVPVTLCKSADGTSCDTDANTAFRRWIVFVDDANSSIAAAADGNGTVDTNEPILKDRSIDANVTTAKSDGTLTVFRSNGFPNAAVTGNLSRVAFCDSRGSAISVGGISAARGVSVSSTGRAVVTRDKAKIDEATGTGGFGGCP